MFFMLTIINILQYNSRKKYNKKYINLIDQLRRRFVAFLISSAKMMIIGAEEKCRTPSQEENKALKLKPPQLNNTE